MSSSNLTWGLDRVNVSQNLKVFRINRGQDDTVHVKAYASKTAKDLVYEIAAQAWQWGLPWAEALPIAQRAMSGAEPKAKAWPKVKAKAKGRGKGKGRGKAQAEA